jgi:hypothetical protein
MMPRGEAVVVDDDLDHLHLVVELQVPRWIWWASAW